MNTVDIFVTVVKVLMRVLINLLLWHYIDHAIV